MQPPISTNSWCCPVHVVTINLLMIPKCSLHTVIKSLRGVENWKINMVMFLFYLVIIVMGIYISSLLPPCFAALEHIVVCLYGAGNGLKDSFPQLVIGPISY